MDAASRHRPVIAAESHTPELLRDFLIDLEATAHSHDVWRLLVRLGKDLRLPFVDFICASSFADWKQTLFIRTSYDSTWLNTVNMDPDVHKWSYFRSHAMDHLTPITIGLEFLDEYHPLPKARIAVLKEAASRGMRAGFSIPLRVYAPPQSALVTFAGDHSRRDMLTIINAHGWTLNTAAIMAHQRYMMHFSAEFPERNQISDKQWELLQMIGQGLQDKVIADQLQVSISAVRQRMNKLMEKTKMSNRAELASLAMSMGILADPLRHTLGDSQDFLIEMGSEPQNAVRRQRTK
jgi:DNA-binding CsgD family transcriptional regulator